MNNTNLIYTYGNSYKVEIIRETFFANQLKQSHKVNIPKQGDFIVDDKFTFEIGGAKNDSNKLKTFQILLLQPMKSKQKVAIKYHFGFLG